MELAHYWDVALAQSVAAGYFNMSADITHYTLQYCDTFGLPELSKEVMEWGELDFPDEE